MSLTALTPDTPLLLIGCTPDTPLLLIGCGKMGGAMLKGWLLAGLAGEAVWIVEPNNQGQIPDVVPAAQIADDGAKLPDDLKPRLIVIAVKPQMMGDALPHIARLGGDGTAVLSIAAGVRSARFQEVFGAETVIIRAMPNTPAAIGKGISAIVKNDRADAPLRDLCEALMRACGDVIWVGSEDDLDYVTGVSGSGPAYVFHMVEAMAKAGEAAGLPADTAMKLARATIIGAGALLEQTGEDAATLRKNVTSPHGTTQAALEVLMPEQALTDLMTRTVQAAVKRSKELSG